jgi:DNA-directed RNA polymerase subunit RPC12/RpoP
MNKEVIFPCEQCGAKLSFSATEGELKCPYCSYVNVVERAFNQVVERDYESAISRLKNLSDQPPREISSLKCPTCAAVFELEDDIHASECPFCGSAVVNEVALYRPIKPQALLPFKVTKKEATTLFRTWLKSHWFAPNKLKRYSAEDSTLEGVYIPYWTYDAQTFSRYSGRRGDKYYVDEMRMVTVNGKSELRSVRVEKIRWSHVSGDLDRAFDDVLVMATDSLKHVLSQWDLENLVDYNESYLSGYESEVYSVELDEGLRRAKAMMQRHIRQMVKQHIGGDLQEITHLSSDYSEITFKHILLPVYASAFKFDGKVYSYVINGRNGDIRGERPYSVAKIASLVVTILIMGVVLYYATR